MSVTKRRPVSVHPPAGRRKRRVNQLIVNHDGVITFVGRKKIVETLCIQSRWRETLQRQKIPSSRTNFVRIDFGTEQPGEYRDVSCPCTRFHHCHSEASRGCFDKDQRFGRRCAELPKISLGLVAARLQRKSHLLRQEPIYRGRRVAQVQSNPIQIDADTRIGRKRLSW